jgi:hypothetical protein
MEYLADVLDLANGAHQHGDPNAPYRDEIAFTAAAFVAAGASSYRRFFLRWHFLHSGSFSALRLFA